MMLGLRQADLARRANMSPSYLNLIEHNKRRIGGKMLLDIAAELEVEPAQLTEGAEANVLEALRSAAAHYPELDVEESRVEELAGRFPGWARLIEQMSDRQASLEQTVASLSDRMTHDPQLAEALHDMLGAITGIRSASAILAGGEALEPEWRTRFSRNVYEDAERLAQTSQALVQFLGSSGTPDAASVTTPQDELQTWLDQAGHRFALIDKSAKPKQYADDLADQIVTLHSDVLTSQSAKQQAHQILRGYAADAERLPLKQLTGAIKDAKTLNPGVLSAAMDVPIACVMRRMAALDAQDVQDHVSLPVPNGLGLAICDGSGTFTYRKPLAGFALPRFGAACPLWPLYQAMTQFATPLHHRIEMEGRDRARFECYAIAVPQGRVRFDAPAQIQGLMLIIPTGADGDGATQVGPGCRLCAHTACDARREPSILASGV